MGGSRARRDERSTTNITSTTVSAIGDSNIAVGTGSFSVGGDFGFTGKQAVNLAAVLGQTSLEAEALRVMAFDSLIQQSGSQFNALIGGASNLVQTGAAAAQGRDPRGGGKQSPFAGGTILALLGGGAALLIVLKLAA